LFKILNDRRVVRFDASKFISPIWEWRIKIGAGISRYVASLYPQLIAQLVVMRMSAVTILPWRRSADGEVKFAGFKDKNSAVRIKYIFDLLRIWNFKFHAFSVRQFAEFHARDDLAFVCSIARLQRTSRKSSRTTPLKAHIVFKYLVVKNPAHAAN